MARAKRVDTKQLNTLTLEMFNSSYVITNSKGKYTMENRKTWPTLVKEEYSRCRVNAYTRLRKANLDRRQKFWVKDLNDGQLDDILKKYGLFCNEVGDIRCRDNGRTIIKLVLNDYIIPDIEKRLGVTGLTPMNKASTGSRNVLDWKDVDLKEE